MFDRATLQPGWSTCVKPIVNTESCQAPHVQDQVSGRSIREALAPGISGKDRRRRRKKEKNMSTSDWLRNERGEWFVIVQTALMLAVLVASKLDGRKAFWSGISAAVGGLLCIVGLGFVVLGSIALGRNLSPFPKPKEKGTLVESGIFSVVRHPIYSGFSLAAFGWGLIWNSIAALVAALLLLAFFDIKARREECWLEEKFPGYAAYKSRVKKLIPFLY
jgi:protein-S-isoprenylcysteine O-methyltransferase Ste14